jgi:lycopene beta-cyclase
MPQRRAERKAAGRRVRPHLSVKDDPGGRDRMAADAPPARPREIAVLGGGLAGLSLVLQLLDHGVDARITVVEPRRRYTDDRTWGFFDLEDHPFRPLIAQRWPAWRVRTGQGARLCSDPMRPYARLPAGAVYAHALARLRSAPGVRLWTGTRVLRLDGRRVVTDAGTLDAGLVFDGRPPPLPDRPSGPRLLQQFVGRRVSTARPAFDPQVMELMDFRLPQDRGIAFLYTLPQSPTEALVEATVFAGRPVPGPRLTGLLDDALATRFGRACAGGAEEHGAIPMVPGLGARAGAPGTIPIGTRAGAPRGATGYAFLPIQRHARALAAAVAAGRPGPVAMRGPGTDWLDRVFLSRLIRRPETAPALFDRLFAGVPPARLARFLMERGSPGDHLAVMAALPTAAFLGEAAAVTLGGPAAADGPADPALSACGSGYPRRGR